MNAHHDYAVRTPKKKWTSGTFPLDLRLEKNKFPTNKSPIFDGDFCLGDESHGKTCKKSPPKHIQVIALGNPSNGKWFLRPS